MADDKKTKSSSSSSSSSSSPSRPKLGTGGAEKAATQLEQRKSTLEKQLKEYGAY